MNKVVKGALAALVAFAIPVTVVSPASATTSFDTLTIDCGTHLNIETAFHFPLYSYPLNVTLVNCANNNIWDQSESGNATIDGDAAAWLNPLNIGVSPATLVIDGPVDVEFRDADDYLLGVAAFNNPIDLPDPAGELLATVEHEIPVIADEFTIGTEQQITDEAEIQIADRCWLIAGPHVYNTGTLTVTESNDYTIRVVSQSPTGDGFHPNDDVNFWDDSLIVVYSEFDPANPENNIVGCGDELRGEDFDPQLDEYGWYRSSELDPISISWPNFGLSLDAGDYTVVYTTYDYLSSTDWETGSDGWWEPAPQTITTELWGPANGASFSDSGLAATGVDPAFGLWSGLVLAGTGVAITVARRRAQRA